MNDQKSHRLGREFYLVSARQLAKDLLGKNIIRKIGGKFLGGKIVETEAYPGPKDKAAHSFGFKITKRNIIEYGLGGYIYIYLVYGMYWQLNIVAAEAGKPECVLIRALEPIFFDNENKNFGPAKNLKLTNGPGKLCQWLKLDKSFYGEDLCLSDRIWLEDSGENIKKSQIIADKRIGIDYAEEWKDKKLRFYIKANPFVSKFKN